MIGDEKTPGIVRGTAVSLLPPHLGPLSLPALEKAATDEDPLVRLGAATTLEALPPKERVRIGVHLLWDPVRAVRVEAVPAFADVPDAELATEARAAFDRSLDDFYLAQRSNAERPESHVNLGIVNVKRGRLEEARRNYDTALRLGPWFVPAYVNLADLLRQQGRDEEGEKVLREALRVDPQNAGVHHALGLLLVRAKRGSEALAELRRAAELAPDAPDFAYTYAIGLHSAGRADEALAVLRAAQQRSPGSRGLLVALVTILRERGSLREAREWARKLAEAAPGDPSARALAASLEPPGAPGRRAVDWRAEAAMAIDDGRVPGLGREAKAAWEITPLVELRAGRPDPGGLRADLYARIPTEGPPGPERQAAIEGLWDRLREIAESLLPLAGRRTPGSRWTPSRRPPGCGRRRSSPPRCCSPRGSSTAPTCCGPSSPASASA